jgi:hypothetical protein
MNRGSPAKNVQSRVNQGELMAISSTRVNRPPPLREEACRETSLVDQTKF